MTMLMMWLGKTSVALATDSKMTSIIDDVTKFDEVKKLHRFKPDKIMFGIEFGDGAMDWLTNCPCDNKHPYPEHWCDCSNAQNLNELERIIRNDLQDGNFPSPDSLRLWLAGFDEHGILGAFVLDGTGQRIRELMPGDVIFNDTSIMSVPKSERLDIVDFETQRKKLEQVFQTFKKDLDDKQTKFSGAKALEKVASEVISLCESSNNPSTIGGPLNYHIIFQ